MMHRTDGGRTSFWGLAAIVLATCAIALTAMPRGASAHPLGNFTINRYARLDLYRETARVEYVLDFAEIPTFQLMSDIDRDHDGRASAEELRAYATTLASTVRDNLDLRIGDARLDLRAAEANAALRDGGAGLDVLRVDLQFSTPVHASDARSVVLTDRNYSDRIGWKEIVVHPSAGTQASIDPALEQDRSDALRSYPTTSLASAPDVREVRFTWTPDSGAAAPELLGANLVRTSSTSPGFEALIRRPESLLVVIASFAAAFGFGALHALGPGHGKAMVAAYLVGSRGKVRHAVALGLTVTATHVSTVYLLGFITIAASAFLVPERFYFYLSLASGLSVVAMGIGLFIPRAQALRRRSPQIDEGGVHRHGLFGAAHTHEPGGAVIPALGLGGPVAMDFLSPVVIQLRPTAAGAMVAGGGGAGGVVADAPVAQVRAHAHGTPDTEPTHDRGPVSWRSLLTLGVLGGLLPCPSALVVMLAAISLGQVLWGMALIVAFSLGLASVLTGIGVALVLGARLRRLLPARLPGNSPSLARLFAALPAMSAVGIAVAGVLIVLQTVMQFTV